MHTASIRKIVLMMEAVHCTIYQKAVIFHTHYSENLNSHYSNLSLDKLADGKSIKVAYMIKFNKHDDLYDDKYRFFPL
jgi:hypothetical protein